MKLKKLKRTNNPLFITQNFFVRITYEISAKVKFVK